MLDLIFFLWIDSKEIVVCEKVMQIYHVPMLNSPVITYWNVH